MQSAAALLEERRICVMKVREHKDAIRRNRAELGTVAARLQAIEAECRKRRIDFVVHPTGVGAIHGRTDHT